MVFMDSIAYKTGFLCSLTVRFAFFWVAFLHLCRTFIVANLGATFAFSTAAGFGWVSVAIAGSPWLPISWLTWWC